MQQNYSLKQLNTFHIEARARWFQGFKEKDVLIDFLSGKLIDFPTYMILGGGSNVLFAENFDGLVVHVDVRGKSIENEDENFIYLRVQAGEDWDQLVELAVNNNWGGLENLSLIPGRVGACPIQNIGAYGVEVKDTILEVECFDLRSKQTIFLKNEDCKFGYRNSIFKSVFKGSVVILSVLFRLRKKPELNYAYNTLQKELKNVYPIDIRAVRDAVIRVRQQRLPDPKVFGNAGSFFKNPVIPEAHFYWLKKKFTEIPGFETNDKQIKVPAAFLIETCGWKGKRTGPVGVHQQQPLVLINFGEGTGNDVLELAEKIKESVKTAFGIDLEMEVNIVRS
jgi:UDP-N-acetylmuramate dehydrogenase